MGKWIIGFAIVFVLLTVVIAWAVSDSIDHYVECRQDKTQALDVCLLKD